MKKIKITKIIICIIIAVISIIIIVMMISKSDNKNKTSVHVNDNKQMEISSKQIRAKYIEEKTGMLLPGTYVIYNQYVKWYIDLIDNEKANLWPIDINGFLYNGYYKVVKIDSNGNETIYKDKTYGSHAVIPYNQEKNCYEVIFYYEKKEIVESAEDKNIELTDDLINRMPAHDSFNLYVESVAEDGTIERHEGLYDGIPFRLEPEPINKDVLDCIYEINYLISVGEKANKNIFSTDELIAGIAFKIIDGKFIFDRVESATNDIEILQTQDDGKVKLVVNFLKTENKGFLFVRTAVLKKNITLPEGKKLRKNISLYNEIYSKKIE